MTPTAAAPRPPFANSAGPRINVEMGNRDENCRAEHRNRVFKRGRIILGDGYSTIDCVVRDLTTRGARITVEDNVALPFDFTFSLLDTGAVHVAIRRWQRGRSMGIEFSASVLSPGSSDSTPRALASRKVIIQFLVEPLICPCGNLEGPPVADSLTTLRAPSKTALQ